MKGAPVRAGALFLPRRVWLNCRTFRIQGTEE